MIKGFCFSENQIILDKNAKLTAKEKRLESETAQLKSKLHDVATENNLLEKNNASLTQETDILKKNLQMTLVWTTFKQL